ncbi:DUF11 domain-containing protein [Paenibacillus rhizoplanae]
MIPANAQISYEANDNRTSTASNTVQITVIQPGLSVRLKVDLYSAAPGDNLRYEFTVQNSGNMAVNALLTDAVPAGVLFVWDSVRIDGVPPERRPPRERNSAGHLTGRRCYGGRFFSYLFQVPPISARRRPFRIREWSSIHSPCRTDAM